MKKKQEAGSGSEVWVESLPSCELHATPGAQASYDGYTVFKYWAFMCPECFAKHGTGLGTGVGQRLMVQPVKAFSPRVTSTDLRNRLTAHSLERSNTILDDLRERGRELLNMEKN